MWDLDPRFHKSCATRIVIGGREVRYMVKADPEIKNKDYLTDESAPILWYAVQGDISDQATIIINEILPDLMEARSLMTAEIV